MLDQTFSYKNLRRLVTKDEIIRFRPYSKNSHLSRKEQIDQSIKNLSSLIYREKYELRKLRKKNVKGRKVYSASSFYDHIVLKKINQDIKRLYRIKTSNRNLIIPQIYRLLSESSPMRIVRLDIKSFYESVPIRDATSSLSKSFLVDDLSLSIIERMIENNNLLEGSGIPRGVSISSSLSERHMRKVDKGIRGIPGVYYYARYVDDIILFTWDVESNIVETAEKILWNNSLQLNDKTETVDVNCRTRETGCDPSAFVKRCKCKFDKSYQESIDFLGYKFILSDSPAKNPANRVGIRLSDKKLEKYKVKIVLALLSYLSSQDYSLLLKRIKFLSSNHVVKHRDSGEQLSSGIFYSYPHCNEFGWASGLDWFVASILTGTKGRLSKHLTPLLNPSQIKALRSCSFYEGAKYKRIRKFTKPELMSIQECWNNV